MTGKSYYYVNNAHGDVVGLVDAAGAVVNRYQYDAFGNTVEAVENVKNRFRYAGSNLIRLQGNIILGLDSIIRLWVDLRRRIPTKVMG